LDFAAEVFHPIFRAFLIVLFGPPATSPSVFEFLEGSGKLFSPGSRFGSVN